MDMILFYVMKRKLMVTNINQTNNHLSLNSLNTTDTTTYGVRNPGLPVLGHVQTCGEVT